jgi:hypothetical protein
MLHVRSSAANAANGIITSASNQPVRIIDRIKCLQEPSEGTL